MFDANRITNISLYASFDSSPANSLWSPVNTRATARRLRDDLHSIRRQEHLRRHYYCHNPRVNPQVNRQEYDREGQVTQ